VEAGCFLEKVRGGEIVKIVATRCLLLKLKCTKFDFGCGSAPDPAGRAYSAPQTSQLDLRGPTSKGRERRAMEGENEREGNYFSGEGMGNGGICFLAVRGTDVPQTAFTDVGENKFHCSLHGE